MKTVLVCGAFDDLRSSHVRFLEEASKLGAVHVLLWSDEIVVAQTGRPPKFPCAERRYFMVSIFRFCWKRKCTSSYSNG